MIARPLPAYAHGAVWETRDPTLLDRINQLQQSVPISIEHRNLLRELGSEFVYVRRLGKPDENIGWLVLVRFGAVLESRFGFTREIPLLYSPFTDLQIRTTDSLEARLGTLPVERQSVSTNEVLVWAPDWRLKTKLESWSRAARVLLPMPSEEELQHHDRLQRFIDLLATKLASRDLYSIRGFVTGDQFFGRAAELQQVADSVRQQEVVGVFGLRKTGKTSLLNELKRSYDSERDASQRVQLFVYQDLEHLPSLSEDPVSELIQDLAENIRRRLKQSNLRTRELAELPIGASPSEFRRALDRILEKIEREATLVLLLDEIEFLCPPNPGPDTTGLGFQRVRQLFGGLRKLVQERSNFAFVVAGLSSSATESPELYGAPNPLFSFARPYYLGPFNVNEAEELLNGIGRKVSMHWTEDAVSEAHRVSGGHALLIRELASTVLQNQRHSRTNTAQIRPAVVHEAIPKWRTAVASHVQDVLPHLRRYYTDEADLAVMLLDDPEAFKDFAATYGESIGRLHDLGIVSIDSAGSWIPTPLLQFSYEFNERVDLNLAASSVAGRQVSIEELVRTEESETLERKETLRSHGGSIPDEVIVDQTLKACVGFLNRNGGCVIVGVADDGTVVGIDRDIEVCGSVDKLINFFTTRVREKIGNLGIDLISVSTPEFDGQLVMLIEVSRAPAPVFPEKDIDKNKSGLFVRNNNTTHVLSGQDILDYTGRHWKK